MRPMVRTIVTGCENDDWIDSIMSLVVDFRAIMREITKYHTKEHCKIQVLSCNAHDALLREPSNRDTTANPANERVGCSQLKSWDVFSAWGRSSTSVNGTEWDILSGVTEEEWASMRGNRTQTIKHQLTEILRDRIGDMCTSDLNCVLRFAAAKNSMSPAPEHASPTSSTEYRRPPA